MSKKQTIFRAPKNAMDPYVMISNELIQDSELSFCASGLFPEGTPGWVVATYNYIFPE